MIIAHINHGKSTLADRLLEITGAVEPRKMRAQYLDKLELERERGITIKMAPVRLSYIFNSQPYILNLIDTPGHSDFSYEVSRALAAAEGAILLVDISKGIQAQTLANWQLAKAAGLKVIGAVNKIDLISEKTEELITEIATLIDCPAEEIIKVSGKTGQGIEELLKAVIQKIPQPQISNDKNFTALIFDSFYDDHKGVVASVRVFNGEINQADEIFLIASKTSFKIKELGWFMPELRKTEKLQAGEIGYIATGIKDPRRVKIGDTIVQKSKIKNQSGIVGLAGYKEPKPVVFVSFFPESADEFEKLKICFEKLQLNDSALQIEPDQNEILGRGFKVGFLGRLHFEITAERLKREFATATINTFPSVVYRVKTKTGFLEIIKPEDLPPVFLEIEEPMVQVEIIMPAKFFNDFFSLQKIFRLKEISMENLRENIKISAKMPLVELISDFDEQLKSATQGYASFSYNLAGYEKANIIKVEVIVAGRTVPGLSRFLPRDSVIRESRLIVEKLKELLPRQQFVQAIQVKADNRIIAREDIPALKKDVAGYLYGGDRTRKMKLWQKQAQGKKKLKKLGQVKISAEIFKELLKKF